MNKINIKIYRIENSENEGPYRNDIGSEVWRDRKNDHSMLPTPSRDKGIGQAFKKRHVCGFKSLKQLGFWFTKKEFKRLKKLGFSLKEISIPKQYVVKGKHQVIFPKKFLKQGKEKLKVDIDNIFMK